MEKFIIVIAELVMPVEMIDIKLNHYKFKVSIDAKEVVLQRNGPLNYKTGTGITNREWSIVDGHLDADTLILIANKIDDYYNSKKW